MNQTERFPNNDICRWNEENVSTPKTKRKKKDEKKKKENQIMPVNALKQTNKPQKPTDSRRAFLWVTPKGK